MGFLQSIFGVGTGAGFQAGGVNNQDLVNANTGVQGAQGNQNALLAALQGQGGIGNQSNVFNQMQNTAGQYQNIANGAGPNPAQAQLAQNTAQNVAQTGALMAGQRGAGANVGLLARQAGQQGAATQQSAAGQAATLGAQQQLAGLQGLQTQQANLANLSTQQVGQQQAAAQQAATTALGNQSNVYGLQSNINTTNAGIAAGNQKAQAGLLGGILGSVGAASGSLGSSPASSGSSAGPSGAQGGEIVRGYDAGGAVIMPNAASGQPVNPNGPQSSFAQYLKSMNQGQLTKDTGQSGGQAGRGLGDTLYNLGKAGYEALRGDTTPKDISSGIEGGSLDSGNTAAAGNWAGADTASGASAADAAASGAATDAGASDAADALLLAADGGQIQPGYKDTNPDPSTISGTLEDVMGYLGAKGGMKKDMRSGGKVAAGSGKQKAKAPGDNYANDKIPAVLSEHEIVLPRSVTMGKDPVNASARFVAAVLAKRKRGR